MARDYDVTPVSATVAACDMVEQSAPQPDQAAVDALATAVVAGDIDAIRSTLSTTPELANARLSNRRSMLHVATDWPGQRPRVAETIRLLIAAGADPMVRFDHPNGDATETPLHWAVSCNDVEAAVALLDGGADIDAVGGVIGNCAPFEEAVIFEQYDAAALLLERGATPYLPGVAALGRLELVGEYFDPAGRLRGSAPLLPNWSTIPSPHVLIDRAFQFACRAGHLGVAQFLYERGARVDAETPVGTTAREEADGNGYEHVIAWLDSL